MFKVPTREALAPAAILLAAALAFGLTLKGGFMWDDHQMIEQNQRLELTAANLAAAFKGDPFSQGLNYYRPLQTVSNMIDFSVWGYRPAGYHLTNLVCHAAAALLFFYLALALGFARGPAFWAGALLAVHPAAVEQLLIIAGRAELAAAACTLASLLLLVRNRTAAAFLFFLAAAGFKETGIIMPALGALCLWRLERRGQDYLRLLPFFAFIPVYLFLRHQALGMDALAKGLLPVLSGLLLKVPQAVLMYLKETLLPFGMHSHRMQPDLRALALLSLPALAAAGALLWKKGGRLALFCAAWYLLNLAPKLPLLATNDLMLDHWVYLANAGLFLGAAAWLHGRGARLKPLLPAALLVFGAAAAVNAARRGTDLENYEHAARRSASKPMLYNLAREYYLLGRPGESLPLLEKLAAADPANQMYLNGLALARWKTGDTPGALRALDAALAARPAGAETLFNKYCVLAAAGDRRAGGALEETLRADPGYPPALLAAARALASAGRKKEAAALYARLLEKNPYNLEALNDRGILLALSGDRAGAEEMFVRALKVSPGLPGALRNLARLRELPPTSPAAASGRPAAP
ncbi:MAG: tetratricopeptide repeat protein [Elusimicrobiales bacterium]|nr:tetratricopeptide repeat protein [Elusimicrobiales bacterium]